MPWVPRTPGGERRHGAWYEPRTPPSLGPPPSPRALARGQEDGATTHAPQRRNQPAERIVELSDPPRERLGHRQPQLREGDEGIAAQGPVVDDLRVPEDFEQGFRSFVGEREAVYGFSLTQELRSEPVEGSLPGLGRSQSPSLSQDPERLCERE